MRVGVGVGGNFFGSDHVRENKATGTEAEMPIERRDVSYKSHQS